jgi:uncharacterized protein (DUF433 family)
MEGGNTMATTTLNWSQCPAVESIPGKRSGAWVFRDTRTPVSVVEWFHLSRVQINAVIEFAARSFDAQPPADMKRLLDAHPL